MQAWRWVWKWIVGILTGHRHRQVVNRLFAGVLICLMIGTPVLAAAPPPPTPEENLQGFLDAQPGSLKRYREDGQSAAQILSGVSVYYGLSPRILLALLEATSNLLSDARAPQSAITRPFGTAAPEGFAEQIDWAARELRAAMGPYDRAPLVTFADGKTAQLDINQAPIGLAVQRFLVRDRTEAAWRRTTERFTQALQLYFNNELPDEQTILPALTGGFLRRPWPAGTRVIHLAYFDHVYPTVDTGRRGDGRVVDYLGRGNVQYDGHDGHDYSFPDQPIGTLILAAADGVAYASTHRGNGVWIRHAGGFETVYWHLDKFAGIFRGKVNTGQGVLIKAGALLGTSGRTGFVKGTPHLHFEVRLHGRQIDPYGWYGPGPDPCPQYAGCAPSRWLWHPSLAGEFDFTPPDAAPLTAAVDDQQAPEGTLTVNPQPGLLLLANQDNTTLQQVGIGTPLPSGLPQVVEGRFGAATLPSGSARLAYPTQGNLRVEAGTIMAWVRVPERYPPGVRGRVYLLAASDAPERGPDYPGTLALRRETTGSTARWNFWTVPVDAAQAHDLSIPDTLTPGWHHLAISWDRASGTKRLYVDGNLAAEATGVALPDRIGPRLELGRFVTGSGASNTTFDELAIFDTALAAERVRELASAPIRSGTDAQASTLLLDLNARDSSGIMSVQIGIDGQFSDPYPYAERYRMSLPEGSLAPGRNYTIAARLTDRAGNTTTVSTLITYAPRYTLRLPLVRR